MKSTKTYTTTAILAVILLFTNCKKDWIRELPPGDYKEQIDVTGKWVKKTMPISPMNSNWYKNEWKEEIVFEHPKSGKFTKFYESIDKIGGKKTIMQITGKGIYQTKGNWILLHTNELKKWESDQKPDDTFKKFEHKLLYYYDKKNDVILPMIYDVAYQEKNFGVRDGVNTPYDETDKNFLKHLRIYTYKDYQPHAYFKQ